MQKTWDILGIGSAAVDDLLFIDRFPQPDEKIAVQGKQRRCGGQTSTALVAAARHGAKVAYLSCFGDDELSEFLISALIAEGVDCSPVIRDNRCTPIHSRVLLETRTGTRTILFDASGFREPPLEAVTEELIRSARMIFIDQNVPHAGYQAAQIARMAGIPVAADIELKTPRLATPLLPLIDHLVVNIDFARHVTGAEDARDMAAGLAAQGRAGTVVTCGSQGSWYAAAGQLPVHQPATPIQAADTTGCGDVFHGVYAAAVVRGDTVAQAVRIASAAAALKATNARGWAGIPTLEEVLAFLEQGDRSN